MIKKTVMIFGVSSFMGSNLADQLKDKYRVIGTYLTNPVEIPGVLSLKCDIHSKELVQKLVLLFKPDVCIYAVGLTDLGACQEFPKVADALNTAGVFNVAMASERYQAKFIYFSTCYIFSGEDIIFRENETPTPSSVYGNTVAAAEFFIQRSCLNYIIFRCCPIFGRSYNYRDLKWTEVIEKHEFEGKKIICDTKVYTGFMDVCSLAEYVDKGIELDITNKLIQVSSSDLMNRYEFAKTYLEIFGGNTGILSKGDWEFPRTENQIALQNMSDELKFSMDIFNIQKEFEVTMPTIEQSIQRYKKSLEGSIKASKRGSGGVQFI